MPLMVGYLSHDILPAAELVPPASLAEDQFVRVRVEGVRAVAGDPGQTGVTDQGDVLVPHRYDLWVDYQSGVQAIRAHDDKDSGSRRRPDPAPSTTYPRSYTPEVLAGLPADPTLLRERLLTVFDDGAGRSAEHRLVVGVADLFTVYDALLPGQVRVAAYRMLPALDGITGRRIRVDGREFVALGHVEAGYAVELLLDPRDGTDRRTTDDRGGRQSADGPGCERHDRVERLAGHQPVSLAARGRREADQLIFARCSYPGAVSEIEIRLASFDSPEARRLIGAALGDLAERYGGGGDETPVAGAEFEPPAGAFLIAYLAGRPVGCGGWRSHGDAGEVAELKRMYTAPEARGRGVARRVLAAVERSAREHGRKRLVLECGDRQPEAIALYEASGYQRIPNFGFYKDAPGCLSYGRTLTEL